MHKCHAKNCHAAIAPKLLMCRYHWSLVSKPLQSAVLNSYRSGQEKDKLPSREFIAAARAAINYVASKEV